MVREGIYKVWCATLLGEARFDVVAYEGVLTGRTPSGVELNGLVHIAHDQRVARCEIDCIVPPHTSILTGLRTRTEQRRVRLTVNLPTTSDNRPMRFSVDFAGRAVDVSAMWQSPI